MGETVRKQKVPDLGPLDRRSLSTESPKTGKLELVSAEQSIERLDAVMGLFSAAATNRALQTHGWGPEREIALLVEIAEDEEANPFVRMRATGRIREICRENLGMGAHFYGGNAGGESKELDGAEQKALKDSLSRDAELLHSLTEAKEEMDHAAKESQRTQTEEDYAERVGGFARAPEDARAFDESRVQPEPLDNSCP